MIYYFDTKTRRTNKQKEGYEAKMWKAGWVSEHDSLPPTRYYTILKRFSPQYREKDLCKFAEDFKDFILAVQNSECFNFSKDDKVYGVPHLEAKDYTLFDYRWINFPRYVFGKLKEVMTPEKEKEINLASIDNPIEPRLISIIQKITNPDSEIKKVYETYLGLEKYKTDQNLALKKVISFSSMHGVYQLKDGESNLPKEWLSIKEEKYPLLNSYAAGKMPEYIRLVDISRSSPERAHQLLDEYLVDKIADRLNPPEEE